MIFIFKIFFISQLSFINNISRWKISEVVVDRGVHHTIDSDSQIMDLISTDIITHHPVLTHVHVQTTHMIDQERGEDKEG